MDLDAAVLEKIGADAEFQATLADLSDEEKEEAINAKKPEVLKVIFEETEQKRLKAEEIAKDQKRRAEIAEEEAKKNKVPPKEKEEQGLTAKDALVLSSAGVHPDEIEEIIAHANFKKTSISEALNSSYIKSYRAEQSEFRKSKEAVQTKGGPQGVKRNTGVDILEKAEKTGVYPQADDEISKMIEAKLDRQAAQAKI